MTPSELVSDFLARWFISKESMLDSFKVYFTPDTEWENVGMSKTTGVEQALGMMAGFESGFGVHKMKVDILNQVASGNLVMNERIDRMLDANGKEVGAVRLMGVFEIENGKIRRWADYFDTAPFAPKG